MNIFILDLDINNNARMHCDKHVVKMIVEYCQLLSTTCHMYGIATEGMYKKTHMNHPCAVWTRETRGNYEYLLELTIALLDEYTHRYGKVHASSRLIPDFIDALEKVPYNGLMGKTKFACVVVDKNASPVNDLYIVDEYRELYRNEKRAMCTWKNRIEPVWF